MLDCFSFSVLQFYTVSIHRASSRFAAVSVESAQIFEPSVCLSPTKRTANEAQSCFQAVLCHILLLSANTHKRAGRQKDTNYRKVSHIDDNGTWVDGISSRSKVSLALLVEFIFQCALLIYVNLPCTASSLIACLSHSALT